MRLKKIEKKILAGILAVTLVVPGVFYGRDVKASETQVPIAKNEDGSFHEYAFELARMSEDDTLSSYEEDNGKHWVKLFSNFDGNKNIFDNEELPDATSKIKVVFDITYYDLDQPCTVTWATGIGGGWNANKPTGVTIDQSGTYEAILDFASETDGIGQKISSGDINAASVQMVFPLGEAKQQGIANVKKTKIEFKACYAYEENDEVTANPVIPIVDPTPSPTVAPTQQPTVAPTVQPTVTPIVAPTASPTVTPEQPKENSQKDSPLNKVKKIKATKKTISVKKGKTKNVTFKLTTTVKNQKTTDKITKVKVANKKIIKVTKKTLGKNKCTIKVKGKKKGNTTLTVTVGKKKAKVKIKVVK